MGSSRQSRPRRKKQKRNTAVLAHLVSPNTHPAHKGIRHRSQNILFRTVCEHYVTFANHCDRTLESPCTGIRCKERARWRWLGGSTAGNGRWKCGEQYRRDGTASTVFDLTVLDCVPVGGRQLEGRCVLAGLHWCKQRGTCDCAQALNSAHCQRLSVSFTYCSLNVGTHPHRTVLNNDLSAVCQGNSFAFIGRNKA